MKTLAWIIGGTSGIGLETAHRLTDSCGRSRGTRPQR